MKSGLFLDRSRLEREKEARCQLDSVHLEILHLMTVRRQSLGYALLLSKEQLHLQRVVVYTVNRELGLSHVWKLLLRASLLLIHPLRRVQLEFDE